MGSRSTGLQTVALPSDSAVPSVSADSASKHRIPAYWAQAHAPKFEAAIPFPIRMALLQDHGNFSMAYSTAVQPHLEYFGDQRGYIAFRRRMGIAFALGDPVCGPNRLESLLAEFMRAHGRPSFVQIRHETARVLESLGCFVNEIGIDTRLELGSFNFAGKDREWLRYADNWITRRKYRIEEGTVKSHEEQIVAVSEAWRATRKIKRKEVRFLNRPIVLADEPDTRCFFMFDESNRLTAFVFFDPVYDAGQIIGYVTCFKRRTPDATQYAEPAIMKRAIECFQSEGKRSVWLGLSPLADITNNEFRCNRLLHVTTRYYHRSWWINQYFYNFVGHTQYKKRFRGIEEKAYYATTARINTVRLLSLCALCGAF